MEKYEEFKASILKMTKIDLSSYKENQMRRRLESLARKHECPDFLDYVKLLQKDKDAFNEFINFMTINVSEFYRNPEQWKLLSNYVEEMIQRKGKHLKIWSAACSTGDEPYSLVMALSKFIPVNEIHILATDLDNTVISKAKIGLYNEKSITNVPDEFKKKYFSKVGESYQISEEIKRQVEFKQHNLLLDKYPNDCDLIVCRNVLIYFTEEAKHEIYVKFKNSLVSGGILFIGSTEQVIDYKDIGYIRKSSFFYQNP
jgi:chemotaxis protein methyltransferase CheR